MLQKRVAIGLFALLLLHTLASVVVVVGGWWQAENDLSERLLVYRSVDSVVEFQIPLKDQAEGLTIARTTEEGFRYKAHYYSVISLEIRGDTLHIAGFETVNPSLWQEDLLAVLNDHLANSSTGQKAGQLLKLLLKEYSPGAQITLSLPDSYQNQSVRIPDTSFLFATRTAPIHSPPPECAA